MSGSFGTRKGGQQRQMDEAPSRHFGSMEGLPPRSTPYSYVASDRHASGMLADQER
jgi:hypothetical protein